jgi:SAM-dependent methyltransferase
MDASAEVVELAASTHARANLSFVVGDAYAIDAAEDTYDVVHAHQVLQHLADPAAALREMRRVCRTGGLVAARDSDYTGMAWYPRVPELSEWLELYCAITRGNGGDPDAGRRLLAYAHAAGFDEVTPSASVWCFATPADREWWAGLWADRIVESSLAEQVIGGDHAQLDDLKRIAAAWRTWASDPDAWFAVLHGEILASA